NIDAAESVYRDLIKNDPLHADTQHMLGIVCLDRGQLQEAEQYFCDAIALDDKQANFHSNLGIALSAQNRVEEAYESFQRALKLHPRHLAALSNAATALLSMGRIDEAKPLCSRILAINPDDANARRNMAAALIAEGDVRAAITLLREGLEIDAHNFGLLVQLASALELVNQLDEASTAIDKAESIQPGNARVSLIGGLIARRQGNHEIAQKRLRSAIAQGLELKEEIEAFNQLGLALDAMGDAAAFDAFERSNKGMIRFVGEQNLNGGAFLQEVAALKKFFTEEKLTALGKRFAPDDDFEPVFFVGFPRSGTTLMEQVLKAHPKLITTDERSPLYAVSREVQSSGGGYPKGLDRVGSNDVKRLRQRFHDFCRDNIGDLGDKQLVDKTPLNIVNLALAKLLFPRAKIIVALRDPRDVCLSCFMQKFEMNYAMANFLDIKTTGLAYEAVMGLWMHYRTLLTGSWMEYRYEDLVEDFDDTVSQVLEFIGVGWHEDVKNYRQAAKQRAITTPSYRDVTAPIDNHAVARWRRYEHDLAPISPLIDPFVETFGYK
ncbi:MAG: sulfotransferase, partial [Xanthomonadales bacterium]|nr:sulfotransferase [Xanthomonadales bacterium]